jgi:hypothetical protein
MTAGETPEVRQNSSGGSFWNGYRRLSQQLASLCAGALFHTFRHRRFCCYFRRPWRLGEITIRQPMIRTGVLYLEGDGRNRTDDEGFADPCLTTWRRRHTRASIAERRFLDKVISFTIPEEWSIHGLSIQPI